MAKVLCIDDEPLMRLVVCDYLEDLGHEVLEAASGAEGIVLFRQHNPDMVLTDLRMPGGDGFLVVEHLVEEAPDTPVVIISGAGTVDEAVKTLRLGAWDYLAKPLTNMPLLAQTLERVLDKARAQKAATQHLRNLENRNRDLERKLLGWEHRHQGTMGRLATAIKVGRRELETIRSHVACGYRILRDIPFEGPVAEAVLQHHERFDGSGYPNGLAGKGILLEARILAVADVYEALCSDRPYRAGLCPGDAADYILKKAGTHFCPTCATAFEQVISGRHAEGEV